MFACFTWRVVKKQMLLHNIMQALFNTAKTVPDYQYRATLTQYRKSREIMKRTEHPKLPMNVISLKQ